MWIIPKNLDVSACVRDTLELNSDLNELSQICEQSLMWRSKPSLAQTWSQRWKRVTWMSHLFGRILKPSMDSHFTKGYTSSLQVIPAKANPAQAKGEAKTTPDGFGRILRESLRQLSLFGSSEKMLADILPLDSPQFIEAYEIWVIQLRQDCLRRQSVVLHTREKDCLSWPTMGVGDAESGQTKPSNKRCGGRQESLRVAVNWPTPEAQNQEGYQIVNGKRIPRLGKQANWPTPQHSEYKGQSQRGQHKPDDRLTNKVLSGLLDQDSPSMNGKSQGLWTTPCSDDTSQRKSKYKQGGTALLTQAKGKLNPDWVEQLMGLSEGWTDCDC